MPSNAGIHPQAVENLCNRIRRVAQLAEVRSILEMDWYKDKFILSGPAGPTAYLMKGDCLDEYRQLIRDLFRLPLWADRFSEPFIQDGVRSILRTALNHSDIEEAAFNLKVLLDANNRFDTEQTVYLPVQSLKIEVSDITIGNVTFRAASDALLTTIPEGTGTTREYFFSRESIFTIAEYRVAAEQHRAIERAEDEVTPKRE